MLEQTPTLADTIVALATARGEAAIAIVRLSGPAARQVVQALAPNRPATDAHRLSRAELVDAHGRALDDALVVEMHAPHSYTGEDVAELHLHGSPAIVEAVIEAAVHHGARLARPGEFTERAFLHGRMDLAQAEAVADLIHSRSELERVLAKRQLDGELSKKISELCDALEGVLAAWRAASDFPEQLPDAGVEPQHEAAIQHVALEVAALVAQARLEVRRSARVVLCGAPNVGKSTLLNAWVGRERVLVDESPGTTRDPIEVELYDGAVRWSLWDTAGIHGSAQGVEARGVAMSRTRIQDADVAVWLLHPLTPIWPDAELVTPNLWVLGSRADLADGEVRDQLVATAKARGLDFLGWVSVRENEGVAESRAAVVSRLLPRLPEGAIVVVRERHLLALREAAARLAETQQMLQQGDTFDVCTLALEAAARALGRILGRDVDMAVLDRIFADFCLGK